MHISENGKEKILQSCRKEKVLCALESCQIKSQYAIGVLGCKSRLAVCLPTAVKPQPLVTILSHLKKTWSSIVSCQPHLGQHPPNYGTKQSLTGSHLIGIDSGGSGVCRTDPVSPMSRIFLGRGW